MIDCFREGIYVSSVLLFVSSIAIWPIYPRDSGTETIYNNLLDIHVIRFKSTFPSGDSILFGKWNLVAKGMEVRELILTVMV